MYGITFELCKSHDSACGTAWYARLHARMLSALRAFFLRVSLFPGSAPIPFENFYRARWPEKQYSFRVKSHAHLKRLAVNNSALALANKREEAFFRYNPVRLVCPMHVLGFELHSWPVHAHPLLLRQRQRQLDIKARG